MSGSGSTGHVAMEELIGARKPIVGMVHLAPLPGSPRWQGSMAQVLERAARDAAALTAGGVDAILVENFLDAPFYPGHVPPETVAAMTAAVGEVARAGPLPVGVNVLRNDAAAALAIAVATGARFIRINVHTGVMLADQGWLEGEAHETLRARARLASAERPIAIAADVLVKHAVPPAPLDAARTALDTWHRGLADVLVVSGEGTGAPADAGRIRAVKAALPAAPVWIGSGVTPESVSSLLALADGVIVGSALARNGVAGSGIDAERLLRFMDAVRRFRESA